MRELIDRLRYAPASFWRCVAVCGVAFAVLWSLAAQARDDGRYSNSPYKGWFDSQSNGRGTSCCHEGDAHRYDGHYDLNPDGSVTVMLDGKPHVLPDYMLLKGPNPTGSAIWWFREWGNGTRTDYCFAPGTMGWAYRLTTLRFCFAELAATPAIIIIAVRAAVAHLVVVWPQRRPLAGGMARAGKEAVLGRWTKGDYLVHGLLSVNHVADRAGPISGTR